MQILSSGNGKGNGGSNGNSGGNGNGGSNGNGNGGGGSGSNTGSGRDRGKDGDRNNKEKRGIGKGKGKGLERGKHKGWYKNEFGQLMPYEYELPAYLTEPRAEVSYEYDEVGNRVKMTADKEVTEYRYNEADQLIAAGDTEYEYDDNGNLITQYTPDETTEYYYDSAGRLSDVEFEDQTSLSYRYDGFGRKVSRSEEYWHPEDTENKLRTESTNYLFDGNKVLKEYTGEGGPLAEYYTGNDQVIARKMFGFHGRKEPGRYGNLQTRGGLMYYHYDALGNVTDLTDHLGDNIAKYRFDAFGGMFAGMLAPYSFQGITGKEYDPKSGLMYYSSRWYNPQIGRFTQPDSFKGHITKPASQHPYAYVGNNPINRIDPTGHDSDIPEWLDWDSDGQVDSGQDDSDTFDQDGDNVADWLQDDYSDEWEYNGDTGWDWVGGGSGSSGGDWGYGGDGGYSGGGGSSYHEPTKAERKTAFAGVAGRPAASVGLPKAKNKTLPPSTQAVKNKVMENIPKTNLPLPMKSEKNQKVETIIKAVSGPNSKLDVKQTLNTMNKVLSITSGVASAVAVGLAVVGAAPALVTGLGFASIALTAASLVVTGVQIYRGDTTWREAAPSIATSVLSIGFGWAGKSITSLKDLSTFKTVEDSFDAYSFVAGRNWSVAGAFMASGQ